MKKKQISVAIAACVVLALGVLATAEGPDSKTPVLNRGTPIAKEVVGPKSLSIESSIDYSRATLRLIGPRGLELSKTFENGQPVHVDLLEANWRSNSHQRPKKDVFEKKDGEPLPNGRYRYEVHFFSKGLQAKYFSGQFFVENGAAVSRDTVRSRQKQAREGLAKPGRERTVSGANPNEAQSKLIGYGGYLYVPFYQPPFYSANTWMLLASYDPYALYYYPYGFYGQVQNLSFANYAGNLIIGQGNWFYLGYPDLFYPQLSVKRGFDYYAYGPYNNPGVGIGTAYPGARGLEIVAASFPGVRLNNITAGNSFTLENWSGHFDVWDNNYNVYPLWIEAGTPYGLYPLFIHSSGNVGMGTPAPASPLHVARSDGTAQVFVEETNGTPALRTQFRMVNNGPVNTQHETGAATWRQQFQNNAYTLTKDGTGGNEMTIIAGTGDMTIRGSLFTGGPSCGAGCDAVLGPDFTVESIDDHAAAMWAAGYLPAIGPTEPRQPVNITEKMGGVLNELEKAHIYIEQLHERLAEQEAVREAQAAVELELRAKLAAQEERLNRLEELLSQRAIE